jgi:hypothetical protein
MQKRARGSAIWYFQFRKGRQGRGEDSAVNIETDYQFSYQEKLADRVSGGIRI